MNKIVRRAVVKSRLNSEYFVRKRTKDKEESQDNQSKKPDTN